jgi:amino acid adenylation domain-containing protein
MPMPTLHSYVEASTADGGDRAALRVGGRTWSFRDLSAAARRVAGSLADRGWWDAGRTIGVLAGKTPTAYVGMLGVLHSGNAYVPLNPRYPAERLARLVEEARLAAVIVDRSTLATATAMLNRCRRAPRPPLLDLDTTTADPVPAHRASPARPQDLAYLMFTSGSTGLPKGVPVTHANATACLEAVSAGVVLRPTDRVSQFAELSFDVSVAELFLAWRSGACVCVPSFAETMAAADFVDRHGVTVWSSVPTLAANLASMRALRSGRMPTVRLSLFCGEPLSATIVRAWRRAAPHSQIVNLYGPTEASIFATMHVVDDPAADVVPIGHPLPGMAWRVDADPTAPSAAPGELLLAGPQVVAGYWNDPVATRRAFVRLPDDRAGRTWYRTGDRVSAAGSRGLLFHGRGDRQVKVRGYRVELGEVEAVLRQVTGASLVAAVPARLPDGRCVDIVAYCDTMAEPPDRILDRCREILPEYTVPTRIRLLPAFPLGDSGKVDYRELCARAASDGPGGPGPVRAERAPT